MSESGSVSCWERTARAELDLDAVTATVPVMDVSDEQREKPGRSL